MYPVPNNVCIDLLCGQCLILGHRTPYKAGVCCLYRGMTITHTDYRLKTQFFYAGTLLSRSTSAWKKLGYNAVNNRDITYSLCL